MQEHSEFNPKTIMVATDLSPASCGAMGYGGELARRFRAKLLLTHVIDPVKLPPPEKANLCDSIDRAESELLKRVIALNEDSIDARVIVQVGNVLGTILHLVDERRVDLMVLGTKGQAQKAGDVVGSVAEQLLRAMPCPVLTVGPEDRISAFDGTHTARVMVTTDFSEASKVALRYAESLAARLKGKLYLLHVEEGVSSTDKEDSSAQEMQFQKFAFGMTDSSRIAEYVTTAGSAADGIVKAVAEKSADLLVMRVHESDQKNGGRLNGVAFDVIRQVKCPVFSLFVPTERAISSNAP